MCKIFKLEKEKLGQIFPDILAVCMLAGLLAFFYWNFLVGQCFMWDDTLAEFYPGANYFAKSIRAGQFPLWFPGVRDGIPFYSDPQMAVFYLPQWLLIPFAHNGWLSFLVYQKYIVLHYFMGSVFMYAFLKHLKLSPIAALGGALVFSLSGFPSLRIVNFVMIQVYVWLPLQLLCVHRLTNGGGRWAWLAFVGAALMSLLAGHQQTTVYCWYLVTAYWLYRSYGRRREGCAGWQATLRQMAAMDFPKLVGTFTLLAGLGAVMLLPAMENWLRTARPRQSFNTTADTSLPRDQLLTLLVPRFFGETRDGGSAHSFWGIDTRSPTVIQTGTYQAQAGYWQYWEFGAYAGQVFWIAVLLIVFNWRRIEHKATVKFFVAVWLAGVWFMLGRYGGLFQVLYYSLPGAALFRGPAKMSCVVTCAAAILCAEAIELVKRRPAGIRIWPTILPVTACGCLWLALFFWGKHLAAGFSSSDNLSWAQRETLFALATSAICALAVIGAIRVRRYSAQVLCLLVILFGLVLDFQHAYADFRKGADNPDSCYPQASELLSFLQDYRSQHHGPFRFAQIIRDQIRDELTSPRNLAYFHDSLEVPEGYTSFYLDNISEFQSITNRAAKLNIQNVALAADRDAQNNSWMDIITNSLPRAKFFARVRQFDSNTKLLNELENGRIDWHNEVAVSDSRIPDTSLAGSETNQQTEDVVRFEMAHPDSYSIAYKVSRPGIIFVSETFYPGWMANNGHLKLVEVFGAFQGIVISEAGSGRIAVHFSPRVFKLGIAITLHSIVITASLAFPKLGSDLQKPRLTDS
jgi:hypothetical protein